VFRLEFKNASELANFTIFNREFQVFRARPVRRGGSGGYEDPPICQKGPHFVHTICRHRTWTFLALQVHFCRVWLSAKKW